MARAAWELAQRTSGSPGWLRTAQPSPATHLGTLQPWKSEHSAGCSAEEDSELAVETRGSGTASPWALRHAHGSQQPRAGQLPAPAPVKPSGQHPASRSEGLTHLPRHLQDLVAVENQAPPHELVAVRQERAVRQLRGRGAVSDSVWSCGEVCPGGRAALLPASPPSTERPAPDLAQRLSPPGSLQRLDPLLTLLLAVTLEAVFPLRLLDETCRGEDGASASAWQSCLRSRLPARQQPGSARPGPASLLSSDGL